MKLNNQLDLYYLLITADTKAEDVAAFMEEAGVLEEFSITYVSTGLKELYIDNSWRAITTVPNTYIYLEPVSQRYKMMGAAYFEHRFLMKFDNNEFEIKIIGEE